MKNSLIILVILASLIASLGDSFTIVIFHLNQNYIAKNLCEQKAIENNTCQGCCQLKKQMEQQDEQEKTNPNQSQRKLLIDFFASQSPLNTVLKATDISFVDKSSLMPSSLKSDIFRPPRG